MERLLELIKIFDDSKIELCFENNSLFLMIPLRKPMFEPGPIAEPEDFIDDAQSLLKEIYLIKLSPRISMQKLLIKKTQRLLVKLHKILEY